MFTYTEFTDVSFKYPLINITISTGAINPMRILYNTFLLAESGFLEAHEQLKCFVIALPFLLQYLTNVINLISS
jgi:hypothetical protein